MEEKSEKGQQKPAKTPLYISPVLLAPGDFDTTFEGLHFENRWIRLALALPWEKIVLRYDRILSNRKGSAHISGRVFIGAMLVQRLEWLNNRKTIQLIMENPYIQYFLGYSSFIHEVPFTASLFADLCNIMPAEKLTKDIDEIIATYCYEWNYGKGEDDYMFPF